MKTWFSFVALAVTVICASAQTQEPAAIVVRPPALTTATAGQTIRLTCVAYGYPLPKITWTSGNLDLADKVMNENVSVGETTFLVSVLQLCDLTSDDVAEYACTATNEASGSPIADSSAKFFLSVSQPVTEPPAIVLRPPDSTTIDVDNSVEMVCVAYGNPVPTITWSRPGCSDLNDTFAASNVKIYSEIVTSGNTTFRKSVMQICNLKAEDSNQYTCTAENGISGKGQASPSASFQVLVAGGAETSSTPGVGTSDTTTGQESLLLIITIVQGVVILVLLVVILVVVVIACTVSKKKSQPSKDAGYSSPSSGIESKQKMAESEYAAVGDIDGSVMKEFPLISANPAYGTSSFPRGEQVTYERVSEVK